MTQSLEDYLEVVSLLSEEGAIRVTDIANRMGVSKPSVITALKNLEERGMIIHERYRGVTITEKGRERAMQIREKHDFLTSFLRDIVGVPAEIAEDEGCKIEHIISDNTVKRLKAFLKKVEACL